MIPGSHVVRQFLRVQSLATSVGTIFTMAVYRVCGANARGYRVALGPCGPSPPSELYVTVSCHTAQAFTKATLIGMPDYY